VCVRALFGSPSCVVVIVFFSFWFSSCFFFVSFRFVWLVVVVFSVSGAPSGKSSKSGGSVISNSEVDLPLPHHLNRIAPHTPQSVIESGIATNRIETVFETKYI